MEWKPRLTRPSTSNKYYASSTYSPFVSAGIGMFQINGNCTSYSWSRWCEILNRKPIGLPTNNAENWYHDVKNFKKGSSPKLGAIICYRKGERNNGSDGAGHVAVVEKINSDGSILVSESGAHNFIFRTSIIKKPYNLRGYELEGFIYLPGDYSNSNDSNSNNNKDSAYKTFVKGVQDAFGARVDGIAGTETLSKTKTISTTTNSRHKVVKVLQTYLKSLGYNLGSYGIDGVFGPTMKNVIKEYQKDIGLKGNNIDGILTARMYTWRHLLKLN